MAFPDHLLDDSHLAFRESAKRFAADFIAPHAFEWEEAEHFPDTLFREAGSQGLLGVGFPEHVGGSGDMLHVMMTAEGLLTGGSSGVVAGLGTLGIALPPLLNLGDDAQLDRVVRPCIAGERIAALAVTEPNAGSDVAGIQTTARPDGDDYVINGSKTFITSGVRADFVITLCRTGEDPHGGLTFFIVEKDTPGFATSRSLKKTGWRASDTAELVYDEVRVPAANRIGPEGSGFLAVMQNFQSERLLLASYGHASADIAYQEALAYAQERTAFGRPIAGFQVTRHKLAHMATRVLASRTLNYTLAQRVSSGETLITEVSMAKNLAADTAVEVCYDAVQILGGMGYMRESLVERLSRDVRILPIGGGTSEIMNEIISKQLLQAR
jgi:acyl-CoA dehydrogenase